MLVLHTLWSSRDYLALWVEDTEQRASVPETWQPGVVHNHPRALPLKGLKFPTRLFGAKGYKFNADQLVVEVPTAEGMPVAKGAVVPDSGEVRLMPWRVPVQVIRPEEALGTLLALASFPSKTGHERGAAFWSFAQLASLGTESIARGDVLPTVRIGDDDEPLRGEWRPFLGTDDVQNRLNAVLDRMSPSACTDFIPGLPLPATKSIAEKFLNTCVHGTCRQALTRHELLPRAGLVRGSHPAFPGWLTALAGASRPMPGSLPDTVTFEAQIEGWYRLAENRGRLFRTCLEIDPPRETMAVEDDEGYDVAREVAKENPWQLTIYLQADDDPDYKVSAERIWTNRRNAAFAKDMGIEDPPAVLRSGLDRIAEACPELAPALRKPRVATIALSTRNAHRFMKDSAPRLVELGMTVVLPPWWAQRHETVGLALVASGEDEHSEQETPAASGAFMGKGPTGILDREALCRFQWQVALGDQRISPKELYRLAQMKQPLVQVGGKWVEIDADQMQTALRYFNKKGDEGDIGISEVMRQGLLEEKVPLPLVDFNLEGALARLAAENGSGMDEMDTPELFEGELRPYQKRGLSWLRFLGRLSMGACLADDMGLGKTVQLLALLENTHDDTWARVEADEKFVPASLLVCPMSVVGNWRREAEKFTPRVKVLVHHGSERLAGDDFLKATREHDLIITTYGLALRDKDLLGQVDWRRIVLDEAQNIKNPSARQTQAIRTLKSNDRLALTGTPVENHLTELWSIMHFLNPGLLGSQRDYKNRFATPIERHGDKEASALLRRLTGPFILRRLKTDKSIIKELPEKMELRIFCNLTREQATLYQAVVDDMMRQIKDAAGIARKGLILTTLMKLKQVCNHPRLLLKDKSKMPKRSGKLARLEELLEVILEQNERTLIFTQFSSWGDALSIHLRRKFDEDVYFMHGGTSQKARDRMVQEFQGGNGPRIFVLSLKAGGVGLNLTAANHIIHYDRWWNPAVEDQASDRAYRIGQSKTVQVRKFVCAGTLEERIDKMIEQKKALADAIIGTGEGWLTELNTDQLAELFTLSQDAMVQE